MAPSYNHDLLAVFVPQGLTTWSLSDGRVSVLINAQGHLRTNDSWVTKVCAIQGSGIGLFPEFFAQEHLSGGELVEVLPGWTTAATSVTVLYHDHRFANPHIRAFIDFLVQEFEGFYRFPYPQDDVFRTNPA